MRKTLPQTLLAAFCAVLACATLDGGGVMVLGARMAAWGGASGWKNPYVTDGLVAMWDGEWNAGGGVHDSSSCIDIITGEPMSRIGTPLITDNAFVFDGTSALQTRKDYGQIKRIEFVAYGGTQATSDATAFCVSGDRVQVLLWGSSSITFSMSGWYNVVSASVEQNRVYSSSWIRDGSSQRVYLNNNLIKQSTEASSLTKTVLIGLGMDVRSGTRPWVGGVHSFRLYSTTATAEEVAHNYAIDAARFNLT